MSRGKKPGKGLQNNKDEPRRIRFELEPDAEDLFLKHLQEFKPDKQVAEELGEPEKRAGKTYKAMITELDLHGLHLDEAQQRVREVLESLLVRSGTHRVKIITGKGHHSQHGAVLAKEIHSFVFQTWRRFILEIEESPDQVRLGGSLLRGHFHVTIQGTRHRA